MVSAIRQLPTAFRASDGIPCAGGKSREALEVGQRRESINVRDGDRRHRGQGLPFRTHAMDLSVIAKPVVRCPSDHRTIERVLGIWVVIDVHAFHPRLGVVRVDDSDKRFGDRGVLIMVDDKTALYEPHATRPKSGDDADTAGVPSKPTRPRAVGSKQPVRRIGSWRFRSSPSCFSHRHRAGRLSSVIAAPIHRAKSHVTEFFPASCEGHVPSSG